MENIVVSFDFRPTVQTRCTYQDCFAIMDKPVSHVLTGKLMAPIYRDKGVSPNVLSRTMEDSGTLGVAYSEYIPYMFLCYLVPVFALIFAFTGFAIWFVDPETGDPIPKEKAPINQK